MVKATFEHEDNLGLLTVTTHFDAKVEVRCDKSTDESFRLGGTAVTDVMTYEGLILKLPQNPYAPFRAFRTPEVSFDGEGIVSSEDWNAADLHCYITEYYAIDMEGKPPGWFISKKPIRDAHHLFVNLDVLDGGGNIVTRYRVSPFTGDVKVMEMLNA